MNLNVITNVEFITSVFFIFAVIWIAFKKENYKTMIFTIICAVLFMVPKCIKLIVFHKAMSFGRGVGDVEGTRALVSFSIWFIIALCVTYQSIKSAHFNETKAERPFNRHEKMIISEGTIQPYNLPFEDEWKYPSVNGLWLTVSGLLTVLVAVIAAFTLFKQLVFVLQISLFIAVIGGFFIWMGIRQLRGVQKLTVDASNIVIYDILSDKEYEWKQIRDVVLHPNGIIDLLESKNGRCVFSIHGKYLKQLDPARLYVTLRGIISKNGLSN